MNQISTEKGVKADKGKRRWRFMPWKQLGEVADVLDDGAKKYSPDNWKYVPEGKQRYIDAACRHFIDGYLNGEKIDTVESGGDGKSHLAHAICCLLFLMWFDDEESNGLHKET